MERVCFLTSSTSIMVELEFRHGSLSAALTRSPPAGPGLDAVGSPVFSPVGDGRPEPTDCPVGEDIRTLLGLRSPPTELLVLWGSARLWLRHDRGWLLTHSTPLRVHIVQGRSTSHFNALSC